MTSISVITAVFNARDTIADALDSVLAQTHPGVQSVVIDGGSTDGTGEILERYRTRLATLVVEPDKGIYDALNKGIRAATGDVVGFLHADDVFASPDALSQVAAAFDDPRVDAVYGDLVYVSRDDVRRVIRHWRAGDWTPGSLRRGWMPPHPTFYVRRAVYERLGAFDLRYGIAADYDCMLRFLAVAQIRTAYVPATLVRMRVGGVSNRSLQNIIRKSREDYRIVRSHAVGGWWTIVTKNLRKVGQFRTRALSR